MLFEFYIDYALKGYAVKQKILYIRVITIDNTVFLIGFIWRSWEGKLLLLHVGLCTEINFTKYKAEQIHSTKTDYLTSLITNT